MNHFPFSLTEDDHFSVIEKYFIEKGPIFHQFESYEHMVHHTIQKIFDECTSIEIENKTTFYKATFGQMYFEKASIIDENRVIKYVTPNEARLRDLTYDSPIFVDIKEEFWEKGEKVNQINHPKVFLLRLPTMVRSSRCNLYGKSANECISLGECGNDPGGYFIVNGKERALICQERLNYNQIYLFDSNSDKYPYIAEIRSMSEETGHSVLLKATVDKDFRNCCFSLPYMSKEVLAGTVFKALGFNNEEIIELICPSSPEEIRYTERLIRESIMYNTKEKAIKYISKSSIQKVEDSEERRIHYTTQVIENELFPHMGISTNLEKGILLGTMINKLFRVCLGKRKHEDRDNVSIKRIEGPGVLISDLFRMCLKRYCDNLKKYLEKRQDIITAISRTNSITSAIKGPFSTGNWGVQKNTYIRTGVSQIMSRLSYPATISHLRRIVIPIGKEGKNVKIRQIHPTQCFFIDTIESPEGIGIGIIKNFALLSKITVGCNYILVRKLVEQCSHFVCVENFFNTDNWNMIYINGTLIGMTNQLDECFNELKRMKYEQGIFSDQVSFTKEKDEHEIRIFCDHGRFMRPLINVEKDEDLKFKLLLSKDNISYSWNELIEDDIIRYIDCNEVEQSLIAMYPSDIVEHSQQPYNYSEIHPSTMLGVCSSVIPYPEHNQNPRLVYEASMMKQALGTYALSFKERFDTISHVMHYPQKPLVETKYNKMLNYDEMLTGCNPIVAICCYTGFNQEDSVMLNKASVDRGMFVTTAYRTISYEEKKKTNCSFEKIEVPPLKSQNKTMNYSKLGVDGVVKKGLPVYKGDIIVGKTLTKIQKDEKEEKMDCSLSITSGEEGIIDDIWKGLTEDGYLMIKVKIRQMRIPEVGDKLASRSSQKGVCGLLLQQEDMPFTNEGISPDLLMNAHCFTKETLITVCNGLSVNISDMSILGGENVWCHNKKNGITMSKNLSMGCGGIKPIVKLTFEDGRTIRCTYGHKFYTSDGRWVEAQNIELKKDTIQMSLEGVFDTIGEDENNNWLFFNNREKMLAFTRILGYLLADGCVCKKNDGRFSCPISFGHIIDAELCNQDIFLLTGKSPKIHTNTSSIGRGFVYIISLPCELVKLIINLDGITIGKRSQQETSWPSFLLTSPKSVIREFLAGLFGGDGHAPYLRGEHVQEVRFCQTSNTKYEDHFMQKMQTLCDLLNRFNVNASIERKRYYHKSNPQKYINLKDMTEDLSEYMTTVYIIVKDTHAFIEKIGMRYCIEKNSRLTLYKSYKLLQQCVKQQSEDIYKLIDSYINKGHIIEDSLSLARKEYFKTNVSLNEYYTFGINAKTQLGNRRKHNRSSDVLHLNYKYFPTFKKYIEKLGCLGWYSNKEYTIIRESSVLPTFHMKVIGRDDDGKEPIYCFNVKEFNNFIAQGIVVHNSQPSRMTLSQLIECLYSKVGSMNGTFGDATAFTEQSINPVEGVSNMLKMYGFQRYGNETLYNGYTGEMLDAELFIGPTYYQRLKHMVQDKIHCLTIDHDVLTQKGWKPITSITKDDKVATLNKDGILEYQYPNNTMNYPDYEGSMYYIKNQSIDLAVTGNHRMWVSKNYSSYDFERADKLVGKMVRYKKDAKWIKKKYQLILPSIVKYINRIIPEKIVDMEEWLVFFGIWYAEGWTSGNETSGRVIISVNKQRVKDALFPSLEKMGFEYKFDEKSQKINIYDNQLYMYMKEFSTGAPLKKMPEWVFELSKEQTRLLLESMIGSISKKTGCKFYYTSSSSLADQFQQLCLHAGWACISSIHLKKGNTTTINDRIIKSNYDVIRLSIITTRLNPCVNHSHVKNQTVQEEKFIENEKCHVVCIEVPNQVFYVRRNGKAVWTGNSRATGNVTMMHHQPSEGRSREGGLRVGEMERDALISHGGAAFIQETLFDMSDQYQVNVCEGCGNILSSTTACRVCKTGQVNRTNIPYCAKLLFQELEAMGIKIQINTK